MNYSENSSRSSGRVVFDGEDAPSHNRPPVPKSPRVVFWVINHSGGFIKDEGQAKLVILGLVAVAMIFSLVQFFKEDSEVKMEAPPGYRIIHPTDAPPRLEKISN